MKCPDCVDLDQKSKVYPKGGSTTLMGWDPYYDEDGSYHSHDPNHHTQSFSCSYGHKWSVSGLKKCLNCDYGGDG